MFNLTDVYGADHGLREKRPVEKGETGLEMIKRKPDHRHPTCQTERVSVITMPYRTAIEPHVCRGRNKCVIVVDGIGEVILLLQPPNSAEIERISMLVGDEQAIPAGWAHSLVNRAQTKVVVRVESDRDPVPGDVTWRTDPPDPQLVLASIESAPPTTG